MSTEILASISRLPKGFKDICLGGKFSVPLIRMLDRYAVAMKEPNAETQGHLFNIMDDVSVMEHFSHYEKAVCLGLYIHHLKLWQANVLAPLYLEGLIKVFLAAFSNDDARTVSALHDLGGNPNGKDTRHKNFGIGHESETV